MRKTERSLLECFTQLVLFLFERQIELCSYGSTEYNNTGCLKQNLLHNRKTVAASDQAAFRESAGIELDPLLQTTVTARLD